MNDKPKQANADGSSGISHPKQQVAELSDDPSLTESGEEDRGQGFAQIDDAKNN